MSTPAPRRRGSQAETPTASPPPALAARAAPLRCLGWTGREAKWLALVCLHSGVFTRRQYADCYGLSRQSADLFTLGLLEGGLAREEPMPDRRGGRPAGICHVHGRSLYRALGIENNRHRRRSSLELTMRRLLSLDYVLEHQALGWLPTEPEKLAYFQGLGIPLAVLPRREYRGPFSKRSTRRYFAFKLPIAGDGATTTFVYAAAGGPPRLQRERIRAWADAHGSLWQALRHRGGAVHVVAVTRTGDDAAANAAVLESWRGPPAPAASLSEADRQLLDAVERAKTSGDLAALEKYGGWLEAGRAAGRIKQAHDDGRPAARSIDAYSTHVADRLAPDALAL